MSDFGALSVGLSGLLAQRRALDVTGHNLANVNTPGASRQRVDLTPITDPIQAAIFSRIDGSGIGVQAGTAYRIRDRFLDLRGLQEHATDANLTQSQTILTALETAVDEPSDTGLNAQINDFMGAWDDLAGSPDNIALRQQVIEAGKTLAASFNQLSTSFNAIATNAGRELEVAVDDVNTTAAAVADLNYRILAAVNGGLPAGDLMDQRDLLVQHLAEEVGATTREQEKGVVDVYIGTTAIVRGNVADRLRVDATTTPGSTTVVWDRLGIQASVEGRAGALQTGINATVPKYRAQLDAVANQLATDVNTLHASAFDLNGVAGAAFFTVGPGGIAVNATVAADPRHVAVAATATALRDGSVGASIAALTGPADVYSSFVLQLGVESASINRMVATQSTITSQVDAARESASGINLDEEMTNLVQIQHAYDAAARFITVVDSMLDTLINSTGLVGR